MIKQIINWLKDLLFPIQCVNCENVYDVWLCEKCKQQMLQPQKIYFPKNSDLAGLFYLAPYANKIIQKIIHQYKYGYSQEIADILAVELISVIHEKFDYIIPVPLHRKRLRERGFNQAELIATKLAMAKVGQLRTDIVYRQKYTHAQAKLSEAERFANTKQAFSIINPNLSLVGKRVLIIDDVYTTGNTINQVIQALKPLQIAEIWAATVAKG
ncbi:MAG: ComF family protein [Patescibacteria group bacterium]